MTDAATDVNNIILEPCSKVPFIRLSDKHASNIKFRASLFDYISQIVTLETPLIPLYLRPLPSPLSDPESVPSWFPTTSFDHWRTTLGQQMTQNHKNLTTFQSLSSSFAQKKARTNSKVASKVRQAAGNVSQAESKMQKAAERMSELRQNAPSLQINGLIEETTREEIQREYECAKANFASAIQARDITVAAGTSTLYASEMTEMEQGIKVLKALVESRQARLLAEQEALNKLASEVEALSVSSCIEDSILSSLQAPEVTHRHSSAIRMLEWHVEWQKEDSISVDSITVRDIEIVQDFVHSCFTSSTSNTSSSLAKYRSRFISPEAGNGVYRVRAVRMEIVSALQSQRSTGVLELSPVGFDALAYSIQLLLDVCLEESDAKTGMQLMIFLQTFFRKKKNQKEFLAKVLKRHVIWSSPKFWGDALLLGIGEEMSKSEFTTNRCCCWYTLVEKERVSTVLALHNIVFGQLGSLVFNMASFGCSRKQIFQFTENIVKHFELGYEQWEALQEQITNVVNEDSAKGVCYTKEMEGQEAAQFTIAVMPQLKTSAEKKSTSRLKGLLPSGLWSSNKPSSSSTSPGLKEADSGNWQDLFGNNTAQEEKSRKSTKASSKPIGQRKNKQSLEKQDSTKMASLKARFEKESK